MTNLEKWRYYFKDRPCPDAWIDLGWWFAVAAALQRRVWYFNFAHQPLFCNLYIVLIGPPATGKNLVVGPTNNLLRYWPFNPDDIGKPELSGQQVKKLIECGPDTITFQKLVERLAKVTRRFVYNNHGKDTVYHHASMAIVLEELNSLFTRHSDQIPKMLLKTYDCGEYEYDTKKSGHDYVRNTCMNFLAGTTPAILKEAEKFHIFDDGFVSRTLFSFETQPRHDKFHIGEISEEQITAYNELLLHIRKLTQVFGNVYYDKGTYQFLEDWSQTTFKKERLSANPKMATYYGRKKVLILKLAAAIHFSESLDLHIPQSAYEHAIEFLKPVEKKMEIGFSVVGRNHLHPLAQDVKRFLKAQLNGETVPGLLARFGMDLNYDELTTILSTLVMAQEIYSKGGRYYAN